jgi:hypothetical protein
MSILRSRIRSFTTPWDWSLLSSWIIIYGVIKASSTILSGASLTSSLILAWNCHTISSLKNNSRNLKSIINRNNNSISSSLWNLFPTFHSGMMLIQVCNCEVKCLRYLGRQLFLGEILHVIPCNTNKYRLSTFCLSSDITTIPSTFSS